MAKAASQKKRKATTGAARSSKKKTPNEPEILTIFDLDHVPGPVLRLSKLRTPEGGSVVRLHLKSEDFWFGKDGLQAMVNFLKGNSR